ncbi:hypothetical protein, partial [Vibrio aestuarianus]|uniref:hypothetical protein n=1 Tax=Vibrio aestuarianus TaxID=28171 RepID=UPI003BB0A879
YHFQQLASSSTPIHECRTYYLKSGLISGFGFVSKLLIQSRSVRVVEFLLPSKGQVLFEMKAKNFL